MRRLLVIEAAAYAKLNTRPLLHPARRRVRKLMHFSAEAPAAWRASFRCFGPPASSRQPRGRQDAAGPREPQRFCSAWPLAERYEALIRVFNAPGRYAARLARRLHAAPHRVHEPLRATAEAEARVEGFAPLGLRAENAWRPHFSSA
jgi:hypothetical protein